MQKYLPIFKESVIKTFIAKVFSFSNDKFLIVILQLEQQFRFWMLEDIGKLHDFPFTRGRGLLEVYSINSLGVSDGEE